MLSACMVLQQGAPLVPVPTSLRLPKHSELLSIPEAAGASLDLPEQHQAACVQASSGGCWSILEHPYNCLSFTRTAHASLGLPEHPWIFLSIHGAA